MSWVVRDDGCTNLTPKVVLDFFLVSKYPIYMFIHRVPMLYALWVCVFVCVCVCVCVYA